MVSDGRPYPPEVMRTALFLGLSLLTTLSASAQPAQESDAERPATRAPVGGEEPARQDRAAPATAPEAGEAAPSRAGEQVGDAPLRLNNQGIAKEGDYAGVTIGGKGLPPKAPRLPLKDGIQRLTWPGFQVRDGVPTVFLQTTAPAQYTVETSPGAVVVTLRRTTIKLRNNQRPLKVAEFGTDVTEVSAKPRGKDVVVTIKRKGEGSHRERVETSEGGYSLLVVELPSK